MMAIVNCQSCELSARYLFGVEASSALNFDAAQFRALCKKACKSPTYDCPELTRSIKAAMVVPPKRG